MNATRGKHYRILVAVMFGMAGFVINFLDLQLLESPELKISILAGLYFPLVIALAWGWRYGLLSALAGGCQSMWWLWRSDGWGFFYAVPVFSLWIIWHGWWAEHRGENHPWYQSCFAVEIPFRIVIEFGFYTIFRWLISLNPPPWNPAITWDYVPMSWVHTVAVKHTITAYILLLAAYITVNVGPVRRFFGLQPRIAQRDTNAIYAAAVLMGLVLWMIDSVADYLLFNPGGCTFWEVAVLEAEPHHIFMRSLYIIVSLVGAVFIAHIVHQRSLLSDRFIHLNKVLRAIRNVNQLITKEKDQDLLIRGACDNLVKNRGFNSAWIALMDDSGKCVGTAHAGIGEVVFQKLKKGLDNGHMPVCAQKALAQPGALVIEDPHSVCGDCPLASSYGLHVPLSIRLEYQGKIYGLLSTSIPGDFSWDDEERELFEELGGNIAFALYNREQEQDRKKAEASLHETESLYRLHFENVNDVIYSVNRELKVINISPSVEHVLGWKPAELIGRPFQELNVLAPEYIEQAASDTMRILSGDRILSVEYQFIAKDGTRKWGEVSGAPLMRDGEVVAVISVARDITDRKQAEEALESQRVRLASLFEYSGEAITLLDLENHIIDTNPAFETIFGYSAQEARGKIIEDLICPERFYYTEAKELDKQAMQGIRGIEIIRKRKDGTEIIVRLSAGPIKVGGTITGRFTVFEDITAHKRAEKEHKKLQSQLTQSQKMEAVGTLAGGVAHDFNNLLTIIIGNADIALMELSTDNPLHDMIEEIKKAGERSSSLTRQLLAFSRKQVIKPVVLDLNQILREMEKMLKRLIGEDVELCTVLEPKLEKVHADPGQLDQVIMNLAVNARDAMPRGGKLTIETTNVELNEEYFLTWDVESRFGSYVLLAVTDTGTGMDEETQSHIFEPFFSTKKKGEGTGLGLSTVYGIIKQSGGFIWPYSEPGHGTTFKIYLPRVEGDRDTKSRKKEQTTVKELSGSETILIAEDDAAVRALAAKILQRYGYRVLQAKEGEEAVRITQEHDGPIHLILTDVIMPKMSGGELVDMIQPLKPEIKVIYMSGYTDDAIDRHGILSPDVEFLQKPFDPEDLVRKIREVLDT